MNSGLFYTKTEYAFIAACDTPFLKTALVKTIVQHAISGADVVIPRTSVGIEPLCAVYSIRCLQTIQNALERNNLKISNIFRKLNIKEIPETVLRKVDSGLVSFFNINTIVSECCISPSSIHTVL